MKPLTDKVIVVATCVWLVGLSPLQAQDDARSFAMGMAYWPPFGDTTPDEVVRKDLGMMLQNSEVILVQIPWCPGNDSGMAEWMSSVARESEKELVIAVDWLVGTRQRVRCADEDGKWRFADNTVATAYQETMARIADRYRPEYMLLGVEVDYYAVIAPSDFEYFLTAYRKTRDRIRHASPNTKVGVSLQYEHMLLTPGEPHAFVRDMVNAFEGMCDFVGLAVYPFMGGIEPTEVDKEYFEPVSDLTVPVAITETAWPGIDRKLPEPFAAFGKQDPYVGRILRLSNDLNVPFVLWASMRDVDPAQLDSGTPAWAAVVGLWDSSGTPKAGLDLWRKWLEKPRSRQERRN